MQEENQENLEKNIDFKATIARMVQAEEIEIPQEEAIMKYEENSNKRRHHYSSASGDSSDETTEEEEHLKRIKKELLESLRRVEDMADKLYSEKEEKNIKKMKINDSNSGKSKSSRQTTIKVYDDVQENYKPKERE